MLRNVQPSKGFCDPSHGRGDWNVEQFYFDDESWAIRYSCQHTRVGCPVGLCWSRPLPSARRSGNQSDSMWR